MIASMILIITVALHIDVRLIGHIFVQNLKKKKKKKKDVLIWNLFLRSTCFACWYQPVSITLRICFYHGFYLSGYLCTVCESVLFLYSLLH